MPNELQQLNAIPYVLLVLVLPQIDQYDVDKEKAVDRISRQLLEHSIITEGYGGEVPIVPVSIQVHCCSASCATSHSNTGMILHLSCGGLCVRGEIIGETRLEQNDSISATLQITAIKFFVTMSV